MADRLQQLVNETEFAGVVVPYHNATGANYEQVHGVAAAATEGPIVGVTVRGDVLKVGVGQGSRKPAYAVA